MEEYHDEDVQDIVLQSLIQQAYKMYKLFNGTFNHILDRGSREALVHKLDLFFPQYLQSIRLERADLVDVRTREVKRQANLFLIHFYINRSPFPFTANLNARVRNVTTTLCIAAGIINGTTDTYISNTAKCL